MQDNREWRIHAIMDSDFILLPEEVSLEEAKKPLLKTRGRLGLVIDQQQGIKGCVDSFEIARCLAEGMPQNTAIKQARLVQPLKVNESVTALSLAEAFQKDVFRPVLVLGAAQNVLGHVSPSRFFLWLLQEDLAKAAEIQTLSLELKRRDEYLGTVAHDIRAPLAVVQLAVDFLESPEHSRGMGEKALSFIERIRRNIGNAQHLVKNLLESVKNKGGMQLQFDQVIWSAVVHDVCSSLSLIAEQKGQTIQQKHKDEIKVYLDAGRVRQVVENLTMNAIKYSSKGATITMTSYLEERAGLSYAVLEIKNPGRAISAEEGQKLFQAFAQREGDQQRGDGIGLGLAIVKNICDLHEGIIEVGSDKPDEVCFRILFPNATNVLGQHRSQINPAGVSILVVDDDEEIREFTEAGLSSAGFHVYTAESGERAYGIYQRHKPQLIISDIRMNQGDGFELLAKVRDLNPETPVILCSGYYAGLERDLKHSTLKPDLFVDKPFRMSELVRDVNRLVGLTKAKAS